MIPFFRMPRLFRLGQRHVGVVASFALLLSACATPPIYEKPAIEVPAAFKESALWKTARPGAAEVPDAWWQLFNDPVLNELQSQVSLGNENLKASIAQVEVARAALASSRTGGSPTVGISGGITHSVAPGGVTPATANSLAASVLKNRNSIK